MKVVIDIPKSQYEYLAELVNAGGEPLGYFERVIMRGTPLPKGHGRLIDADMLPICQGVFLPRVNGNALGCPEDAVFVSDIEDAPTIIEADEESEKK